MIWQWENEICNDRKEENENDIEMTMRKWKWYWNDILVVKWKGK